jgi:hypothetical protein
MNYLPAPGYKPRPFSGYKQSRNPSRGRKADAFTINVLIFIFGVMAGYAWAALAYGKF